MQIKEYIVRHPAGVLWGGKIVPAGETIIAADGGAMKAYLHFKQVAEAPSAAPATEEPDGSKPGGKRSR